MSLENPSPSSAALALAAKAVIEDAPPERRTAPLLAIPNPIALYSCSDVS
jgi:hypothetical protein